jgi:DNA-binding response OmpR family regulator
MKDKPRIAVFNGEVDILAALKDVLEQEGYEVRCGLETDVVEGKLDIHCFMEEFRPSLIVWDLAPCYKGGVSYLIEIKQKLGLPDTCIILTSTNPKALVEYKLEGASVELLRKPFDIDDILNTVKVKIEKCKELKKAAA